MASMAVSHSDQNAIMRDLVLALPDDLLQHVLAQLQLHCPEEAAAARQVCRRYGILASVNATCQSIAMNSHVFHCPPTERVVLASGGQDAGSKGCGQRTLVGHHLSLTMPTSSPACGDCTSSAGRTGAAASRCCATCLRHACAFCPSVHVCICSPALHQPCSRVPVGANHVRSSFRVSQAPPLEVLEVRLNSYCDPLRVAPRLTEALAACTGLTELRCSGLTSLQPLSAMRRLTLLSIEPRNDAPSALPLHLSVRDCPQSEGLLRPLPVGYAPRYCGELQNKTTNAGSKPFTTASPE